MDIEPRPAEFRITPLYRRNVIVGFRVKDPSGNAVRARQKIFEVIHKEFPGISRGEFDDASVGYHEFSAEVRLPR